MPYTFRGHTGKLQPGYFDGGGSNEMITAHSWDTDSGPADREYDEDKDNDEYTSSPRGTNKGAAVHIEGMRKESTTPWSEARYPHDSYSGEPAALFKGGVVTPASGGKIHALWASEGHEHLIGTLLGMAGNRAFEQTGKFPDPSDDLSYHSSRLVKKLQDKGVVSKVHDSGQTNHIGRASGNRNVDYDIQGHVDEGMTELPQRRVEAGSKAIRQTIKQRRATHVSEWGSVTPHTSPPDHESYDDDPIQSKQFRDRRLPGITAPYDSTNTRLRKDREKRMAAKKMPRMGDAPDATVTSVSPYSKPPGSFSPHWTRKED